MNLQALRADEMAQGRNAYMAGATTQRAGDMTGQGLAQEQAEIQAKSEMAQRELGQQGQLGYERMGFDVNKAAMDAENRKRGIAANNAAVKQQNQQADNDRFLGTVGAVASMGGPLVASAVGAGADATKKKP